MTVFRYASDRSLLIDFGEIFSRAVHERVRGALAAVESAHLRGVLNLHPAYCSILIVFDPLLRGHWELEREIRAIIEAPTPPAVPEPRMIAIPVFYGGEFGPDLEELSAMHSLSPAQAIERHASAEYLVCFLGFAPGFAYLSGLPGELATPRLSTPRKLVAAGSVGIADRQTGVYPLATPGGWRLIGRTPLPLFHADSTPMSLLRIGDHVKFRPISPREWS